MSIRALLILLLVARTAAADVKITSLRWVDAPPVKEQPDKLPVRAILRAVISGASPGLRREDVALKVPESMVPVSIQPLRSVPFATSDDDLAIAILVQGNVRFMGGPDIPGYYDEVKQAIDVIAQARPRHTRIGLYVYGAKVVDKAPMGPADAVSGDLLGAQAEYAEVVDKAFQRGLEEAHRVLSNEPARRVLFVIGDGSDQREDYSPRHELDALRAASVEVYVLGASPREPQSADRRRLELLGRLGTYRYANQREQVVELAHFLVNAMNNVYTVDFPDVQQVDGQMLPTDGEEHDLVIKAGVDETEAQALRFPGPLACLPGAEAVKCICAGKTPKLGPPCEAPPPPSRPWWLLGAALAVAAAGVVLILRRRRPDQDDDDEAAVPEPLPPEPIAPVAAPPPIARKTGIYRPLDLNEDIFPLVAWIVPLNGLAAFQTFRLGDRTLIGAAADCDVRIDDPLISGHHAEILLREGSFILVDRDSRNGVRFLEKPVKKHTLIDNDLFTCGGTSFKFKTTGD